MGKPPGVASVRLLPGASMDHLIADLNQLAVDANNIRSGSAGQPTIDVLHEYLRWTEKAEQRLVGQLRSEDLAELIHTRSYWALRGMDGASPRLLPLVFFELQQRERHFEGVTAELSTLRNRWGNLPGEIVVPDTNVFLEQTKPIDEVDWLRLLQAQGDVHLVIPLVVVDELDHHKRSQNQDVRRRARHAIRKLHKLLTGQSEPRTAIRQVGGQVVTLEVLIDPPGHQRLSDTDYEIIDRSLYLGEISGARVRVVTEDLGMRLRATEMGLEVIGFPNEVVEAE